MCQIHQMPEELAQENEFLIQKWREERDESYDLMDIIDKYGSSKYKKYIEDALKN